MLSGFILVGLGWAFYSIFIAPLDQPIVTKARVDINRKQSLGSNRWREDLVYLWE